jgi:hypothetical protein
MEVEPEEIESLRRGKSRAGGNGSRGGGGDPMAKAVLANGI